MYRAHGQGRRCRARQTALIPHHHQQISEVRRAFVCSLSGVTAARDYLTGSFGLSECLRQHFSQAADAVSLVKPSRCPPLRGIGRPRCLSPSVRDEGCG